MNTNELKKALEYNTKNAGQQLLQLTNDWNVHIDSIEKKDIINTIHDIAIHMLQQWEKYKKYEEMSELD